jgi:hypothetical protein
MKNFALAFFVIFIFCERLFSQVADFESTDFSKADSVAALYHKHSLSDLRILADKLTKPLNTEQEKFRAIYSWVSNDIENDYTLYLESKRKREKLKDQQKLEAWNKNFTIRVFKTLINEHRTVCSGYAYLVKELALHAGLSCAVIDGYGRTAHSNIGGKAIANHTWNAVELHGKWYLCDATWSSGSIDPILGKFVKKYDDSYFLADPTLFVRSHYPLDSTWILLDNEPTLQAFLNGPLIYRDAFRYNVNPLYPETFDVNATKGKAITFRFRSTDKPFEKIELQIQRLGATHTVYPEAYTDSRGLYCIDHTFTTKGKHIVHVLFNGGYASTYSVTVK